MSASNPVTDGVHYSVPESALQLLRDGILENPLVSNMLPTRALRLVDKIHIVGKSAPTLPVNWRIAEASAALHGLEALLIGLLLEDKYGVPAPEVLIDTDHAVLFPMSLFLWTIDPAGEDIKATLKGPPLRKYILDADKYRQNASLYRNATSNIYKTADGKWFHTHMSLNPDPVLDSLDLPRDASVATVEESWMPFKDRISQMHSKELWEKTANIYRIAGDTCQSVEEYLTCPDGKCNAHVGLFEMSHVPSAKQGPSWWPSGTETTSSRPLAGLKVVDLTRIIAGPAVTRGLAELGASVMRVISPEIPDFSGLHIDLNWGKWNSNVDLKTAEGRETLRNLIKEADVVVNGYRPGVLDKFGFSQVDIIDLVANRDRGIISVRENCYGWHGPSSHRPGWQPVSDAFVGMSVAYGTAQGLQNDEPVTPLFPTSDYATGVVGVCAVLSALLKRAEKGGSFKVDLALNYYNQWLARSVGTYPEQVWADLWANYGKFQFKAENNMEYTAPRIMKQMTAKGCFEDRFFEARKSRILNVEIRCVRPVICFPNSEVELKYHLGTRGNGRDAARWPDDLLTEIVT